MKKLNLIKKKISEEVRKVAVNDPLKLLEFCNGVVIQIIEKYTYES